MLAVPAYDEDKAYDALIDPDEKLDDILEDIVPVVPPPFKENEDVKE